MKLTERYRVVFRALFVWFIKASAVYKMMTILLFSINHIYSLCMEQYVYYDTYKTLKLWGITDFISKMMPFSFELILLLLIYSLAIKLCWRYKLVLAYLLFYLISRKIADNYILTPNEVITILTIRVSAIITLIVVVLYPMFKKWYKKSKRY